MTSFSYYWIATAYDSLCNSILWWRVWVSNMSSLQSSEPTPQNQSTPVRFADRLKLLLRTIYCPSCCQGAATTTDSFGCLEQSLPSVPGERPNQDVCSRNKMYSKYVLSVCRHLSLQIRAQGSKFTNNFKPKYIFYRMQWLEQKLVAITRTRM